MRLPFFVHAVIQCITAQLQDRQLRLESAGFIVQAALELNNVFAAAQTGQLNWPVPVLACSGVLLFAAGWVLNRQGKKKN